MENAQILLLFCPFYNLVFFIEYILVEGANVSNSGSRRICMLIFNHDHICVLTNTKK